MEYHASQSKHTYVGRLTALTRLHYTGTKGCHFSENFSSIRPVLVSPLEEKQEHQEEDETNMPPHMNPKTPPGVP